MALHPVLLGTSTFHGGRNADPVVLPALSTKALLKLREITRTYYVPEIKAFCLYKA